MSDKTLSKPKPSYQAPPPYRKSEQRDLESQLPPRPEGRNLWYKVYPPKGQTTTRPYIILRFAIAIILGIIGGVTLAMIVRYA